MRIIKLLTLNSLVLAAIFAWSQMQALGPKDTFAAARLSPKEMHEIQQDVERSAYDTPDSWTKELRVKRADLGGIPGLIVAGSKLLCGGTGNCQIWVFRNSKGNWEPMFDGEEAPLAEAFELGPTATRGVKDFTLVVNSSAESGRKVIYKFDGKFYRSQ